MECAKHVASMSIENEPMSTQPVLCPLCASGPLDTDMQLVARTQTGDADLRRGFSEMFAHGQLLSCEASSAKLMKLLLQDSYTSGAHVDFYDL